MTLSFLVLVLQTRAVAQTQRDSQKAATDMSISSKGFPHVFSLYSAQETPPVNLENSPRLENLVREGKLELTLADALALALENNLDIAVQRYLPRYAQTDLLRAQAGQSPRGFTGASIPGGLTAGALGAGVTGGGSGSGVGSAGGISGGGGAVQVGSSGNFDPTFNMNFSWDRNSSPLNTTQVSGVPTVTGQTTAITTSYAQLFHEGASFSLSLNGQRQTSTQQFLRFNPAYVTRFSFGVNQPLLNGFGYLANERYILVARNNTKVSQEVFRLQVINTLVAVLNTYWDLAAFQQSVRVAEQALAVSERLFKDNQARLEIGTMSTLDVVSAASEVAARTRDLTVARTNLQLQEAALKNILSKRVSPELDAARIVLLDRMPEPRDADLPDLQNALASAMESRPELRQAERGIENQDIAVRFTDNALLPATAIFGFLAGAGLQGEGPSSDTGLGDSLKDTFGPENPEYAGGVTLSIPIKNRQAQADNLRAQLEGKQLKVGMQRSRNQIALEVRKSIIGLIQGKAQVEAAHQAVRLAREIYDGEKERLTAGASTSYQVILRERDVLAAEQAEVNAMVTYAKALVEVDRARGATLERNGIELEDALSGAISRMPAAATSLREPKQEVR
jgi:outer membrane protein TolC